MVCSLNLFFQHHLLLYICTVIKDNKNKRLKIEKMKAKWMIVAMMMGISLYGCSGGDSNDEITDTTTTTSGTTSTTSGSGSSTSSSGSSSSTGAYTLSSGSATLTNTRYTATSADENAIKVTGGTLTLTNDTIVKSAGDASNSDNSSFYGTNAAILASGSSSKVVMTGGTITTNASGANAIVAYGGTVEVSDVTMTCSKNLSRGIHATGGGTITAKNLTITTAGNNSSVIATDRGGGTVTVTGGTYKTTGGDCAVIYSTGTITANNITGSSSQGEVGVIEGSNSITINNCTMSSSSSKRGMMILQSGSGDATGYNGKITVNGGTITLTGSSTPLIEITTSTTGTLTLKDVSLTVPSGILMLVDYNTRWSTTSPVAYLVLDGTSGKTYKGDVQVDSYGTSTVTVNSGITWTGAYNNANTGKSTKVIVNGTWNLSADSYVGTVTVASGGVINKNGHTLTYSSLSNSGTID
jgi:hypothetical protein